MREEEIHFWLIKKKEEEIQLHNVNVTNMLEEKNPSMRLLTIERNQELNIEHQELKRELST